MFCVDPDWLRAFAEGAWSIGHVVGDSGLPKDCVPCSGDSGVSVPGSGDSGVTGVLIRAKLVREWPAIVLSANDGSASLKLLRQEKLAPDLLLALFEGHMSQLEVGLPPEHLHFGLDPDSTLAKTQYIKFVGLFPNVGPAEFASKMMKVVESVSFNINPGA